MTDRPESSCRVDRDGLSPPEGHELVGLAAGIEAAAPPTGKQQADKRLFAQVCGAFRGGANVHRLMVPINLDVVWSVR